MAHIPKPPVDPTAPQDIDSQSGSDPVAPQDVGSKAGVNPAAPQDVNSKAGVDPSAPSDLTSQPASDPSGPNDLTSEAAEAPVAPSDLTSKTAADPSGPNDLTSQTAESPVAPVDLTSEAAEAPAAPNSIASVAGAAVGRPLTPLVNFDFVNQCYARRCQPVEFDDIFTYSRNSTATFINRSVDDCGKVDYFIDTDYVGDVENLLTYSEQLDNAAYPKTRSIVTPNVTTSPDGKKTADQVTTDTTAASSHYLFQSFNVVSGTEYNLSCYVKEGSWGIVRLRNQDLTGASIEFSITAGQILSYGSEAKNVKSTYEGDGWYRISFSFVGAATSSQDMYLSFYDGTSESIDGTGNEYFYAWGFQLTESAKVLPYVKSISSATTETFEGSPRFEWNPETEDKRGVLIEGSGTNLALRTEDFTAGSWTKNRSSITANDIEAPDRTFSADKLVEDNTAANTHQMAQTATVAASSPVTMSIYARAGERNEFRIEMVSLPNVSSYFDLQTGQIGSVGSAAEARIDYIRDGWYRCSITYDSGAGGAHTLVIRLTDGNENISYDGDGVSGAYFWGAQIEELNMPTSYIRTEGSTVSRSRDDLTYPQAGNVPGFGSEFSVYMLHDKIGNTSTEEQYNYEIESDPPSVTQSFTFVRGADVGTPTGYRYRHGTQAYTAPATSNSPDDGLKSFAMTFDPPSNSLSFYADGEIKETEDAGDKHNPSLTTNATLGASIDLTKHLFGHIAEFQLYDVTLTAQEVAQL